LNQVKSSGTVRRRQAFAPTRATSRVAPRTAPRPVAVPLPAGTGLGPPVRAVWTPPPCAHRPHSLPVLAACSRRAARPVAASPYWPAPTHVGVVSPAHTVTCTAPLFVLVYKKTRNRLEACL
jgi:hypothetical protein